MRQRRIWLSLALLIPYVALLVVPFYNFAEPSVAGFPFFYIWQGAWIIATSIITWLVFRAWG